MRKQPFLWTPEMLALLGTETDAVIAFRLGISTTAVQRERKARSIPPCRTHAQGRTKKTPEAAAYAAAAAVRVAARRAEREARLEAEAARKAARSARAFQRISLAHEMRRAGKKLAEIGGALGVTLERARQLLLKKIPIK